MDIEVKRMSPTAIEMLDQLSAVCKRFGVDYYAASQNQRDLLDSIALHEYQLKKAHEQGLKRSEVPPFLGLKRSDRSNDMPLSLCGGLLSLAVMWVLYYLLPVRPTWFILSVCGALAHNVGQLLGAGVIISSSLSLYYAPVMLVLGLVMGALTSVTLRALLPALGKRGFNTHENRPE